MHKIGFHVSIGGSISNSIKNAENIGCTAFQIFTRNPRSWKAKPLEFDDIEKYKITIKESYIDKKDVFVEMPYLPNLALPQNDFYFKSREVLAEEIIRCFQLDISYLILHLGNHLGGGVNNGITQIVNACHFAIDNFYSYYKRHLPLYILLENSAGHTNSIGSKFEEINILMEKLGNKQFGVCFDTCNAFASGYDLRTSEKVIETIKNFNDKISITNLKVLHLNDSKSKLNKNKERHEPTILGSERDKGIHEHIGFGLIGKEGFKEILNNKYFKNIPIIMETPVDKIRGDKENMATVLELLEKNNE